MDAAHVGPHTRESFSQVGKNSYIWEDSCELLGLYSNEVDLFEAQQVFTTQDESKKLQSNQSKRVKLKTQEPKGLPPKD